MNRSHKLMKLLVVMVFLTVILGFSDKAVAQTWIELAPTGAPPQPVFVPKNIHYDAANNRLIAFYPGNPPFNGNPPGNGNEVWVLTNANGLGGTPAWIKLLPSGSPPFSNGNETAVYDAVTNRLIVYGGCFANCSPALSNVFVLSNANGLGGPPVWSQSTVTNPQARAGLSAVDDSANNLLITFGGHLAFFGTDHNDTRILSNANGTASPSTWTTLGTLGGPPGIRDELSAIYDQANNRMTIFAGHRLINTCCPYVISDYNDAWVLSNANGQSGTPTWTQLSPLGSLPGVRSSHSGVYDPANNRMIVFGGSQWNQAAQTGNPLGDLWQLTHANGLGGTPEWSQLSQSGAVPGPRFYHTAAFDNVNQRMIILGGRDQNDVPSNRVWVLILNQAPTCVPPPSGLVGWWPGDGNANDIAGSNDGTLVNGAAFGTGLVGQAFRLDGVDDAVEIPNAPNLNPTQQITIDAWVYPTATSGYPDVVNMIVNKEELTPGGTIAQYEIGRMNIAGCSPDAGIPTGNLAFSLGGVSGLPSQCRGWVDGGAFLPLNTWSHVALTYDGAAVRVYVNGVLSRAIPGSGTLATSNGVLRIGARNQESSEPVQESRWAGGIDELEIFNRALTASEVQAIFNAGSAGKCKTPANRLPVANCKNVTVSAGSACTANASIDDGSFDPDGDSITITQSPSGSYPLGTTNVTLTVTDSHGASSECTGTVTVVDDTPPVIACPNNITANTDAGQCSAVVNYAAPEASDNCSGVNVVCSPLSGSSFPSGTTTVNCTASDSGGLTTACTFTVTVNDAEAPVVSGLSASPSVLWPPNHKIVDVMVSYNASDNCSSITCSLSVTSNEPINGTGDGDTAPDWVIVDAHHVRLRAERAGTGNGRIYTITITCTDGSGNSSSHTVTVAVPKSQG